jgi:uncharacterized protein YegP (UPF0339 family)
MLEFLKNLFRSSKFELKISSHSQYYFILKASNGEIILTSEFYKNKQGALNGVESVKRNSINKSNYENRISTNGQRYFVLKANNNKIIGISELYNSMQNMEKGIKSVTKFAKNAKIEEFKSEK